MNEILGLNALEIAFSLLVVKLIGGSFALYLFIKSNKEKKQAFIWEIYEGLYKDVDTKMVLDNLGSGRGFLKLKEKIRSGETALVESELELNKTLRSLDYIGIMVKNRQIGMSYLMPLMFEFEEILTNSIVLDYYRYLKGTGLRFEGLDHLVNKMKINVQY